MRAHISIAVVAAIACGCKDRPKPAATAAEPAHKPLDADALWALAPNDADLGIVVSPKGLAKLEAGYAEIDKLLASTPALAPVRGDVDRELADLFGVTTLNLSALGLSHDQPAAIFEVDRNREIVILPVADRGKFLAATNGKAGAHGVDIVGRSKCKWVKGAYACARDVDLLGRLGRDNGQLRAILLELAGRGDIEVVGVVPVAPPLPLAAAIKLERGTITARGALTGLAPEVMKTLANATPRTLGDNTAGFAVVDLRPFLGNVPAVPVVKGVSAQDLVHAIGGPLTVTVAAGTMAVDARVPLHDPKPVQTAIDQCNTIEPFSMIGATVSAHRCHLAIPPLAMHVDVWIEDTTLRLAQTFPLLSETRAAPMSATGVELAHTDWIAALYGRGLIFGRGWALEQVPPQALGMLRMAMLVHELGLGVRADGGKLRFLAHARTLYANPEPIVRKFLALDPEKIALGYENAAIDVLVANAKDAPLATDLSAGYGGIMVAVAGIGVALGYLTGDLGPAE